MHFQELVGKGLDPRQLGVKTGFGFFFSVSGRFTLSLEKLSLPDV